MCILWKKHVLFIHSFIFSALKLFPTLEFPFLFIETHRKLFSKYRKDQQGGSMHFSDHSIVREYFERNRIKLIAIRTRFPIKYLSSFYVLVFSEIREFYFRFYSFMLQKMVIFKKSMGSAKS